MIFWRCYSKIDADPPMTSLRTERILTGHDRNINEESKSQFLKNSPHRHKKQSVVTKEDKYSTRSFKRRKLHQFLETEDVFSSFDSTSGRSSRQSSPAFNYYSSLQNEHSFFRDNNFARLNNNQLVNQPQLNQFIALQQQPPQPVAAPQVALPPNHDDSSAGHRQEGSLRAGFQRIRVTPSNISPGSHPFGRLGLQANPPLDVSGLPALTAGFTPIGDNNPFARFQRVINPLDGRVNQSTGGSGFRRVPVFSSPLQTPAILPNAVQQHPQSPTSVVEETPQTSVTLKPAIPQTTENSLPSSSQRPFRRVRPNGSLAAASHGGTVRRVRPAASVRVRDRIPNDNQDTTTNPSTEQRLPETTESSDIEESVTATPPSDSRRIVRIRTKPGQHDRAHLHGSSNQPSHSARRRVVFRPNNQGTRDQLVGSIQPVDDERLLSNSNAVDSIEENPANVISSNFGHRLADSQADSPVSGVIKSSQPIVPLTYFTTYTYLTTVLRGSHALTTSRISTTSVVATQALDSSLVSLLRDSGGVISPTRVINIGSRTKGPTTTIVNLQSEIRASVSNLKAILATTFHPERPSSHVSLNSRELIVVSSVLPVDRNKLLQETHHKKKVLDLSQILSNPQSLLTKYTYYYTVIDGSNTRKSTRSEVASSRVESPLKNNFKIEPTASVDSDGMLPLGSGAETVHLGKRSHGRSTTEVNLVMETYLKLEGISNVVSEQTATSLPDDTRQPTTPLPDDVLIKTSFSPSSSDASNSETETPDLMRGPSSRGNRRQTTSRSTPSRADIVRSRVIVSGRQRVRVTPSLDINPIATDNPTVEQPTSPVVVGSEVSRVDPSTVNEESLGRRRVAVTVRRPYGGLHRLKTRVTSRPVTESLPVDAILSTSSSVTPTLTGSSRLNRYRVSSRIVRPNRLLSVPSISLNANEHPEPPIDEPVKPTAVVNDSGQTVSLSYTTIPIIRGSETSYRTLTVSATVSPASSAATESTTPAESTQINPTAVLVTYYTTTTHTIPFTVGDKTLYTTFEMTNTRVATASLDSIVVPSVSSPEEPDDSAIKTLFTTFTFFTTFFSDETSSIKSSEKIVSNIVTITPSASLTPIEVTDSFSLQSSSILPSVETSVSSLTRESSVVLETSEKVDYSSIVSTHTFYATLYNGNSSSITPIEETKTEVLTLREPITVTRTILQDGQTIARQYPSSHFAPVPSVDSVSPLVITVNNFNEESTAETPSLLTTTRITHTTLTHFITLHSGMNTILSSVEEISPTVVTETVGFTPFTGFTVTPYKSQRASQDNQQNLLTSFVPSVSTHILTNTFFTTLYSGTTSLISSRSDVTSSLVTLYVPTNAAEVTTISPSSTVSTPEETRQVILPSLVADTTTTTSEVSTHGETTEGTTPEKAYSESTTTVSSETEETTKNGPVVDLEDILSGSSSSGLNANVGNAIKDIVQLLAAAAGAKTETAKTPEPVYVPSSDDRPTTAETIDLAPVFKAEESLKTGHSTPPVIDTSFTSSQDDRTTSSYVESVSSSVITPSLPEMRTVTSSREAVFSDADQSTGTSTSPTRFVTSVEAFTRTLTLTTTKVYYTRDSPLTITSVLTTVIPPKTFVSTIIGSRTILGTAAETTRLSNPVTTETPSETLKDVASTTVTTTTLIFNSITTTVVRTLVIPTEIQATKTVSKMPSTRLPSGRPTRKPLSSVRTTIRTTPPSVSIKAANTTKKRAPLPKPAPPEIVVSSTPKSVKSKNDNSSALLGRASVKNVIPVTLVVDDDQCTPACNAANKETCIEKEGKFKCDCKAGFSRRDASGPCKG